MNYKINDLFFIGHRQKFIDTKSTCDMIRGLITPVAAPKKARVFASIRINKQNHRRRKSERSPRCISMFHRLFTLRISSPNRSHLVRVRGRRRAVRRVRGPTPRERWRRLIVVNKRSWRVAGAEKHSSVDRPRRRRSRSLIPRIKPPSSRL